jgi:Carboxypeptidase regulatory-like domain
LRPSILVAILLVGITLLLMGSNLVFAAFAPKYYGGAGGTISGIVVGPTGNVVDWAQIYANNGNQTFEAFSGFNGLYLMRVPAGTFNVSVYDFYNPQYWAQAANVTVTDGSLSTVNFYLQQPPAPIAEFPADFTIAAVIVVFGAACVFIRRLKR